MLKNKKQGIYVGLVILIIIALVFVIRTKNSRNSAKVVREITPVIGTIQSCISTTGIIKPQNRLEIKPPINGRVEEIKVVEGEIVAVGQTLAWVSSTERAALLDAARAQGEESLKYWQDAYKPTPLIAPITGEVIVRAVEPGQTITSSDAVIVLSDRLIVKAQVDETDIGKVKIGQTANISLDAYPQIKVRAKVDHISYESEIVNNVTIYEVDILPENVPEVFRSGMSANVEIVEQSRENALIIPFEAVQQDKEGSFVFLSAGKGRKPIVFRVELGISDEDNVEVVSGVSAKDRIVILTQKYVPSKNGVSGSNPFMPFDRKRR